MTSKLLVLTKIVHFFLLSYRADASLLALCYAYLLLISLESGSWILIATLYTFIYTFLLLLASVNSIQHMPLAVSVTGNL